MDQLGLGLFANLFAESRACTIHDDQAPIRMGYLGRRVE